MADFDAHLLKTSRTFALCIPRLPEPTRREVTLTYLLLRVADTFEDAAAWPRARRIAALERLGALLARHAPAETAAQARAWEAEVPCAWTAYRELLADLPDLLDAFFALAPPAVELIRAELLRTILGMAGYVARTDETGELRLADLADLRGYCYVVAGIVGELLTELYLLERPELAAVAPRLRERAPFFGEGLQLVNILKDSADDLVEGRCYLPAAVDRGEALALAREDLCAAVEYVLALQAAGAERGLVAFNALPAQLALATLEKVEAAGPGAKLRRSEVYDIVDRVNQALDAGRPAVPPAVWDPAPHHPPLLRAAAS
ncbi:MAG TPA: squalene/phytoene synthase family protein [Thermoanaerobaculia bacterium]|nr:squalene/phytoene synthase family protein [Thermoanaerobaculia bacterium]